MLVKIIHLDEPRCGGRVSKSDAEYWYRKTRYQVYRNGAHLKDFECGHCGFIGSLIVDTESIEGE